MLLFSLHCRRFGYVIESPTDVAVPLDPATVDMSVSFDECLFLLVSVEQADEPKHVTRAARAIGKLVRHTGAGQVVLNGFASLSKTPAEAGLSRATLEHLHERLREREPELPVATMPFGWRKQWTMDVIPGEWSQRGIHV